MKPDIEKYRKYVDKFDLPEEKKIELIHAVWLFLENTFDREIGDDPVQVCLELQAEKGGRGSVTVIDLEKLN